MIIPKLGDKAPKSGNLLTRWLGRSILRVLGWSFKGEIPNVSKLIGVAGPHTSNWEFVLSILSFSAIGVKCSWCAKHSIFIFPFKNLLIKLGGIPIIRNSNIGYVDYIANEFKSRDKLFLSIMPEGTRKRVNKIKTGVIHIAQKADIPIVAVLFDYKNKTIVFDQSLKFTGDTVTDEASIKHLFTGVQAKYPEKTWPNRLEFSN